MPSRGDSEQIIRRAYRAFAERDLDALRELSDPKIEVSTVTGMLAGREGPYRGHRGLDQYLADIAAIWRRIELVPQQFNAVDDGRTLVFGRVRAWRESGFIDTPNAWLWTIRDDRVIAVEVLASPSHARELFDLG
jgi:ketosteroid isomerase-like protein